MQLLPQGFVYLDEINKDIVQDIKYCSNDNLVGRPLIGYEAPKCILTVQAALAISRIAELIKKEGLGLKVFDGYRPQRAVDDLIQWSQDIQENDILKKNYYPNVDKAMLFELQYLVAKSSHTRGSTVDLTLIHLTGENVTKAEELDMGTPFDFMDELSHTQNSKVSITALNNRLKLKSLMENEGFISVDNEWWHFTLRNEPFPQTYFDFLVK